METDELFERIDFLTEAGMIDLVAREFLHMVGKISKSEVSKMKDRIEKYALKNNVSPLQLQYAINKAL